jgi:hypothetical protein
MKAPVSMRLWFAFLAAMIWTGIYFTGLSIASWLLYLPAAGLTIAAIIGFCPSQIVITKLFRLKQKATVSKD